MILMQLVSQISDSVHVLHIKPYRQTLLLALKHMHSENVIEY